ncbi:uncharacterized protein K452DRAFT_217035 [Aplosporella prunicola CBS 121167]|uniref:Major facilitator superfamily (MFS) profile domain-containing protein n=1 Tax=Aplosporella prunicola CBS 121167 TaxID=1176127 RepID=A0A6A6BSF0_9PEZI|nr:uncharacterized protein K452DRAFT_217035 [Aplosporella prunicola CBS 121167]KAF2147006.1 hypothetical protein K452DRAFT_217035 [Aplosporella prunicola CBS 121167]
MLGYFKEILDSAPREPLNWRLYYIITCFGFMGVARGLDESLVAAMLIQKSFVHDFGLDLMSASRKADVTGNITSIVQLGSLAGALIAFIMGDGVGRLWIAREMCTMWLVGVIVYMTSDGQLGWLYVGRFILGIGLGQMSIVAPMYLAECAEKSVRGFAVSLFGATEYFGMVLGYFASYGAAVHLPNSYSKQWVIPQVVPIIFAAIILALLAYAPESPRYLINVGKEERAAEVLSCLRGLPIGDPALSDELSDIRAQLQQENSVRLSTRSVSAMKELVSEPGNRYRLVVAITAQLLTQWSGASNITLYAPEFFAILGVPGHNQKLLYTAILGIVKLVASLLFAIFVIDLLGRKRSLMAGISLQFVGMLYIAVFLTVVPSATDGAVHSPSQRHASTAAIAFIYLCGTGYAIGWNSMQYLVNAEIFPLRARALGMSGVMVLHFANRYGANKALPEMLLDRALQPHGTFYFFAAVTALGLAWVWGFLPELAGKSLEETDAVFELPWYKIGRYRSRSENMPDRENAASVMSNKERSEDATRDTAVDVSRRMDDRG